MGAFIASLLALACQGTGQIGEISKEAFLSLVSSFGYHAANLPQYGAKIGEGQNVLDAFVGFGRNSDTGEVIILTANARADFDLPRTLPKKALRSWQEKNRLTGVSMRTFLGGKIVLDKSLFYTSSTKEEVKSSIQQSFEAFRALSREVERLGGARSTEIGLPGRAPLNLDDKLDDVDPEDLDYLREQMHWDLAVAGGGHGWITGAKIQGISIFFNGMLGLKPGFFLVWGSGANPKTFQTWSTIAPSVKWANVYAGANFVSARVWLDTSGGMTVRQILERVLEFASNIRSVEGG